MLCPPVKTSWADEGTRSPTTLGQKGDEEEMVSDLPVRPVRSDKLDYFADYTSDYIPGYQIKNLFRIPKYGLNVNSQNDTFVIDPLGNGVTIDGSKSYIEAKLWASYTDGTPILPADGVSLAPECNNILFQTIQMQVNDVNVVSSQRQDVARHVMRRVTTSNGDRTANCYRHEFMGSDSELNSRTAGPASLYHDPIVDKKKFFVDRPLDDLPMHGQLDSDIPPGTKLQYIIYYCQDGSRLFRSADGTEQPMMSFDYIEFNWYTNKLTLKATDELQNKMRSNEGTFLYVSDQWKADLIPNGNIMAGQSTYSPTLGSLLQSTFDVAYIVLFPQSSFSPTGDASKGKSIYVKSWANTDNFQITSNGANVRNYTQLTSNPTAVTCVYRGIVNSLSSKWDAAPYRACSPFDFIEFLNGSMAMFPVDLRYVNSEDIQHPEITNLNITINFGPGGCSEDMVPYLVTKSKIVLNYLPDGTVAKIR